MITFLEVFARTNLERERRTEDRSIKTATGIRVKSLNVRDR